MVDPIMQFLDEVRRFAVTCIWITLYTGLAWNLLKIWWEREEKKEAEKQKKMGENKAKAEAERINWLKENEPCNWQPLYEYIQREEVIETPPKEVTGVGIDDLENVRIGEDGKIHIRYRKPERVEWKKSKKLKNIGDLQKRTLK